MSKIAAWPGRILYWIVAVPVILLIVIPRFVLFRLGIRSRNLQMRDRACMEGVTGQTFDPELRETAPRNTKGQESDAAGLWTSYAILKHQREEAAQPPSKENQ